MEGVAGSNELEPLNPGKMRLPILRKSEYPVWVRNYLGFIVVMNHRTFDARSFLLEKKSEANAVRLSHPAWKSRSSLAWN